MKGPALMKTLQQAGVPVEPVREGSGPETECSTLRINVAGNKLGTLITAGSFTTVERLFRRFPVDGTLTATPERPFSFELGAVDVPQQMAFILLDTRWAIHVPSGIAVGDTQELEDRRLSTVLGYDIRFTDSRQADLRYELEPSRPASATTTFAQASNAGTIPGDGVSGVPQSLFEQVRAQQTGSAKSSGLSTMPQRHRRDSQLDIPFTYLVSENKRLNFEVTVFRPIPIPISFFEVEVAGLFVGLNSIHKFIDSIRPCITPGSV